MMSFSDSVKTCFIKKFGDATGRASRSEFWWFQLFIWSVIILLILIGIALDRNGGDVFLFIALAVFLITLIPNICSRVRRLHDSDHSGANLLWPFLLGALGNIMVLILLCQRGNKGENEYGPNPLIPNIETEPEYLYESNVDTESGISENNVNTTDYSEEITDVDL